MGRTGSRSARLVVEDSTTEILELPPVMPSRPRLRLPLELLRPPEFFLAAAHVEEHDAVVSPFAYGFCVVHSSVIEDETETLRLVDRVLAGGRSVVIDGFGDKHESICSTIRTGTGVRELVGSEQDAQAQGSAVSSAARLFLTERAIQQQLVRRHPPVAVEPEAGGDARPPQRVRFVGVGTHFGMTQPSTAEVLRNEPVVVTYPRTLANLTPLLHPQAEVHLIDYIYENFDMNVREIDRTLVKLRKRGHDRVAVVVEGNPQVCDVASVLDRTNRLFDFIPATPVGIAIGHALGFELGVPIMEPTYLYLSGYAERHGENQDLLSAQLADLMRFDVTCVFVEMYSGNIETLASAIRESGRPKFLVLISNAFTERERWIATDPLERGAQADLDLMKGELATVLVIDVERCSDRNAVARSIGAVVRGGPPMRLRAS